MPDLVTPVSVVCARDNKPAAAPVLPTRAASPQRRTPPGPGRPRQRVPAAMAEATVTTSSRQGLIGVRPTRALTSASCCRHTPAAKWDAAGRPRGGAGPAAGRSRRRWQLQTAPAPAAARDRLPPQLQAPRGGGCETSWAVLHQLPPGRAPDAKAWRVTAGQPRPPAGAPLPQCTSWRPARNWPLGGMNSAPCHVAKLAQAVAPPGSNG